jgi:hypothetical protein
VGFGGFGERHAGGDDRFDLAGVEGGPDAFEGFGEDLAALLERAGPEGGAGDGGALGEEAAEVDLGGGALLEADDREAAVLGEGLEVRFEVGRADDVEDGVGAAGLHGERGEVLIAVVDDAVGAERLQPLGPFGACGRPGLGGGELLGELDREGADAARAAVHEDAALAVGVRAEEVPEVRVDGGGDFGDSGRVDEGDLLGPGEHESGVHGDVLGVAASGEEGADLGAEERGVVVAADVDDRAGDLESGPGGRTGRARVVAGDLEEVGAVDAGGGDLDEDFIGAGRGLGHLGGGEAAVGDGHGKHLRIVGLRSESPA